MDRWEVTRSAGPAQDFHDRALTPPLRPTVWIHQVDRPTLVLGSTQKPDVLLSERALKDGYAISTRRSGGGLVLVEPETSCWIDVVIPAGHHFWKDDVSTAFYAIGQVWINTLAELNITNCEMHRGRLLHREHGRLLCFAGLGPGEITIEGRKVVGLSQRRVRAGARFQGLLIAKWDDAPLRRLINPAAWPDGFDVADVRVGHSMLTPDILKELPDTFIHNLERSSQ